MKDAALRLRLLNEVRKAGRAVKKDFEKTTKTWRHKPKFEVLVSLTGPGPVLLVGTDDKIYRYVDEGTRPHLIWAGIYTGKSRKRLLVFNSGFEPKTQPRVIGSSAGAVFGAKVMRPYVQHPGTEAREFDKTIQRMWESKFKRRMEAAMRQAAKDSGHAL